MDAIEVAASGDSAVLELTDRPEPTPGPDEVAIDVAAAGVNFADIEQRRGRYPDGPEPPFVPGLEVAGTVTAVPEDSEFTVGDRVAALTGGGGYAAEQDQETAVSSLQTKQEALAEQIGELEAEIEELEEESSDLEKQAQAMQQRLQQQQQQQMAQMGQSQGDDE